MRRSRREAPCVSDSRFTMVNPEEPHGMDLDHPVELSLATPSQIMHALAAGYASECRAEYEGKTANWNMDSLSDLLDKYDLGLPEEIVWRHPFPGPGLAVRCLGEVTSERLATLRKADTIVVEEIKAAGLYRCTAQAFAVLLPVQSVGVMGDGRTYDDAVAVRCVDSEDFMTADWSHLSPELLSRISNRIINEVVGVNRVVYDISSKPPATIEWE